MSHTTLKFYYQQQIFTTHLTSCKFHTKFKNNVCVISFVILDPATILVDTPNKGIKNIPRGEKCYAMKI